MYVNTNGKSIGRKQAYKYPVGVVKVKGQQVTDETFKGENSRKGRTPQNRYKVI